MVNEIGGVDPNAGNPNNQLEKNQAPVDPSNTSDIGQRIEQGVVDTKKGISEQSSEWEDRQERSIPHPTTPDRAENYIKDPSPEEINIEKEQDE
jgi:hypothetical protein